MSTVNPQIKTGIQLECYGVMGLAEVSPVGALFSLSLQGGEWALSRTVRDCWAGLLTI